ncbi:MAG: hypothetical protein SYC29_14450 [Planctomycetota bacterium]|nr:hypothetical protein [Planctomycetota bacterium]
MTDSSQGRRRPWYRPRNVILAIVLVILLVCGWAVLETWRAYTAEPAVTIDSRAELTALCESRQPPGANGWIPLAAVLDRVEAAQRLDRSSEVPS